MTTTRESAGGGFEKETLEQRVEARAGALSDSLRAAADYVAANPLEVASRSLRALSEQSGMSPATLSRMARALGFDSFEALRESCRTALARAKAEISLRAQRLQEEAQQETAAPFLTRQSAAAVGNIAAQTQMRDERAGGAVARCEAAVELMRRARKVVVVGAMSSAAMASYLGCLASWFATNWTVIAEARALTGGMALAELDERDVVVAILKRPFARSAVEAAALAAARGVPTVVITDSHACPALKSAAVGFVTPTESPQFFPSHAATIVLIETLAGMLLARIGPAARERVAAVEATHRRLGAYWEP